MPKKVKRHHAEIVDGLYEIAQRMTLQGGNRFRAQAYRTAADSLSASTRPLAEVIAAGELTSIPGIGSAIAGVIERLYKRARIPPWRSSEKAYPQVCCKCSPSPACVPTRSLSSIEKRVCQT